MKKQQDNLRKQWMITTKILQNIGISSALFLISCKDNFQKKAETLPVCPNSYITTLSVKGNDINNIGNVKFNFYLTPISADEYYFFLHIGIRNISYFIL